MASARIMSQNTMTIYMSHLGKDLRGNMSAVWFK